MYKLLSRIKDQSYFDLVSNAKLHKTLLHNFYIDITLNAQKLNLNVVETSKFWNEDKSSA